MNELYEAVLARAKTAVEKNATSDDAVRLINLAIKLYSCLRSGVVTAFDLFSPDSKEIEQ